MNRILHSYHRWRMRRWSRKLAVANWQLLHASFEDSVRYHTALVEICQRNYLHHHSALVRLDIEAHNKAVTREQCRLLAEHQRNSP